MSSAEKSYTLEHIASILGAELHGDGAHSVIGLADLASANSSQVSFLSSSKYLAVLEACTAGAVIVRASEAEVFSGNKLIVADPYESYARLSQLFESRDVREVGVHPSASVHETAIIGEGVAIGPNCVIGANASIGAGTELYPGVFIGERAVLGENCLVFANVVIYHEVRIGDDVLVHANTSIGSDGFGFAPTKDGWKKIHQLGRVVIGNKVEIGANTAIDRGALSDTIIGNGVIIDNQVHIAHNVEIGDGCAIAGCVGIAGSTKIGKNCQVAGAVAINGHIEIADNTIFHGGTIVTRGNKEAGMFASTAPMQDVAQWRKNSVRYRQLDELFARVKKLEKDKT